MSIKKSWVLLLALTTVAPSYSKNLTVEQNPEDARKQLQQMGSPYNKKAFLKLANRRNPRAAILFLEAGMDPNVEEKEGLTALMHAATFNFMDLLQALLDKGANVDQQDRVGCTALVHAARGALRYCKNIDQCRR